jgi:mannose-6-phosphate isomerase
MRTVDKPWGSEIIWAETSNYVGKILIINPGQKLSRQYHNTKEETFMVLNGVLTLEIGSGDDIDSFELDPNETYHCLPGTIHRMINDPDHNNGPIRVVEVSTNHLDDVVRIEDDYGR